MAAPHQIDSQRLVERSAMIREQVVARGISERRVLVAMQDVPREMFMRPAESGSAYADRPASIGFEQTISQPFTVAFMAEALQLRGTEKVLEVGTGSGYGAAVLSRLAAVVQTIERIPQLAQSAAERLQCLGFDNVGVHCGDGSEGVPALAPFDAICVTAAAEEIPRALIEQLGDEGRMLIPVGPEAWRQQMLRCTRRGNEIHTEDLGPFAFVPLVRGGDSRPTSPLAPR